MQFGIVGIGPGATFRDISSEDFERLKTAKRGIVLVVAIEDKFDLVIANYEEFERDLLGLALHQMTYSDLTWSSMRYAMQLVNRRVVNLLTAARLYVDQIMHDLSSLMPGDTSVVNRLRKKRSEEYDNKLGYRAMEALRNYTQHRDLPVHALSYPSSWLPSGEPTDLVYRAVPYVQTEELRQDKRMKEAVIVDLERIGKKVPLTPLIREYVESLSLIHQEFREGTEDHILEWETRLTEAIKECVTGPADRVVRMIAIHDDGRFVEEEHIFDDLLRHRADLARKNQVLVNLSKRSVSGACHLNEL